MLHNYTLKIHYEFLLTQVKDNNVTCHWKVTGIYTVEICLNAMKTVDWKTITEKANESLSWSLSQKPRRFNWSKIWDLIVRKLYMVSNKAWEMLETISRTLFLGFFTSSFPMIHEADLPFQRLILRYPLPVKIETTDHYCEPGAHNNWSTQGLEPVIWNKTCKHGTNLTTIITPHVNPQTAFDLWLYSERQSAGFVKIYQEHDVPEMYIKAILCECLVRKAARKFCVLSRGKLAFATCEETLR